MIRYGASTTWNCWFNKLIYPFYNGNHPEWGKAISYPLSNVMGKKQGDEMNKKSISILIGLTVTIALGICFYYTPHWSVSNMKKAAENRQAELSEGKILKVIEKVVFAYKVDMIQAGNTPKEKKKSRL